MGSGEDGEDTYPVLCQSCSWKQCDVWATNCSIWWDLPAQGGCLPSCACVLTDLTWRREILQPFAAVSSTGCCDAAKTSSPIQL